MKWLKYVLHAAVLAGLVFAAMKYVDGETFWRAIRQFNWAYLPFILLCSTAYFMLKALRFCFLFRQVNGASAWMVARAYLAGQACAVLPGGITARAGLLKEAGIPVAESSSAIIMSSLSDQVALLLCALVSALWFDAARKPTLMLLSGLIILSLLLGLHGTRSWILQRIERLMGRFNLLDRWQHLAEALRHVASVPTVLTSLGLTALSVVLMVIALDLALHGVGAEVSHLTLLLAFTLPSIMGRLSAMPAGLGVTEAGMMGILDTAPGVSMDQAAAAVTVFRLGTVLFEALAGAGFYFLGWHGVREAALVQKRVPTA